MSLSMWFYTCELSMPKYTPSLIRTVLYTLLLYKLLYPLLLIHYMHLHLQSYELKLATLGISDLELSRVRAWLDRMQRLKKYRIDRIAYIKVRLSVYE